MTSQFTTKDISRQDSTNTLLKPPRSKKITIQSTHTNPHLQKRREKSAGESGTSEHYNTTGKRHAEGPSTGFSSPRAQQREHGDEHDGDSARSRRSAPQGELLALHHLVGVLVVRFRLLRGRCVWLGRGRGAGRRGGEHRGC